MPIKKIINTTKVPIKIWTEDIEESALAQAMVIADTMPVHSHFSLMSDVHMGKGMPIGGVLPLVNAISPYCVGVDIGCGVLAVKTDLNEVDEETLGTIFRDIRKKIPIGPRGRRKGEARIDWLGFENAPQLKAIRQELKNARTQLGTLGGGNHFIEVQKGSDGNVWWMIHSGSRNIGFKVANFYHQLAIAEGIVSNGNEPLAYFRYDSSLGQEYFAAMQFCLDFAYQNRKAMSDDVESFFKEHLDCRILQAINIHHNYAIPYLTQDGTEVILHRKGATEATPDTIGIIPGSQGSPSFIVGGKGEAESYESCSHGAGRKLSRTMAQKVLQVDECVKSMLDVGLKCDASRFSLDEAKEAYKDIHQVLDNQTDLVTVITELRPYRYPAIKG